MGEPSTAPAADSSAQSTADFPAPHADTRPPVEQPSWREPDAPALPARMNRRRTAEKRDQHKTIRFTPTAVRLIGKEADRRSQTFAGFVGDAALAAALGHDALLGSPEDSPLRPLIEAIEAQTTALNRIGNNLNQVTQTIHTGAIPDHTEAVLAHVAQAIENSYRLIDQLVQEGAGHGA